MERVFPLHDCKTMTSIFDLQKKIIKQFPRLKVIISNIITAEIKNTYLIFRLPSLKPLIDEFNNVYPVIKGELKNFMKSIDIEFIFQTFKMPIFPYLIQNSKHRNYIFFVMLNENDFFSCIIQKSKLYETINDKKPLQTAHLDYKNYPLTEQELNLYLYNHLESILPHLKEKYCYLQTLFPYENYEKMLYYEQMYSEILSNLTKKDSSATKFIGDIFFTYIDYKDYLQMLAKEAQKNES
jgi:hypothetical protein